MLEKPLHKLRLYMRYAESILLEVWNGEGCKFDQSSAPWGGGTHLAPDTFSPSSSSSLSPTTVLSMSTFAHSSMCACPVFAAIDHPSGVLPSVSSFADITNQGLPSPIPSRVSFPPSGCLLGKGVGDTRD